MKGRDLRRLKEELQQGPADVIVGKSGLTDSVIAEIKRRLREKRAVKVKMLKSALQTEGKDRKEMARSIAERVGARLLEVRGRTMILYMEEENVKSKK